MVDTKSALQSIAQNSLYAVGVNAAITEMKSARARMVVNPVPVVAFGGRKIAFLMQPNGMLIELIEAAHG